MSAFTIESQLKINVKYVDLKPSHPNQKKSEQTVCQRAAQKALAEEIHMDTKESGATRHDNSREKAAETW